MAARIHAAGWGYRYPGRAEPALRDVSFDIAAGDLVVLMGASGSGKSTLLSALAGTLPADGASGALVVDAPAGGLAAANWAEAGQVGAVLPGGGAASAVPTGPADAVRPGLVQQEPEGNVVMERVGDDVAFPLENIAAPAGTIWARVAEALHGVGLDVGLHRPCASLSGGQQQLLALAAATVAEPPLLLLDEPTANLDPGAAASVLDAVQALRQATGCTVVVVEHRVEPWLAQASAILLAEQGTITALRPESLAGHLGQRPDLARRVWLDHRTLPSRPPVRPAGAQALRATQVSVAGRLPHTDLAVAGGEVVALTGPPGSGKSTLLSCLSGLLAPTTGSVEVVGVGDDPWAWPSSQVAGTFGVVFQNPEHQFVAGQAREELRHGLAVAGIPDAAAAARADAMLGRLGLAELAQANPFTLSGGEQRRLSVGTALILDPGILLLDEPTFGQDPATWAALVDIIAGHRAEGGAVVLATHDPHLVRSLQAREVHLGAGPAARPRDAGPAAGGGPADLPATPGRAAAAERLTGLRRLDPLALLGAAGLLSVAALLSASPVVNLVLATVSLLAAVIGGLPVRHVLVLGAPALLATVSVAVSNALLSDAGPLAAQSWAAAALPATRVLAVAMPGLVAAVAVDPTALADSLVVRGRVPPRAAYSALAGLRLIPLLADEWTVLARASRARGIGGRGLRARAAQFGSMTFRLLVAALRRGARLAVALDARGLRPSSPRTVARPPSWSGLDSATLAAASAGLLAAVSTRW